MRQVLIDKKLYVLRTEPYIINQDLEDADVIYVHCNYIEGFKQLNPDLELTPYNYLLLTKHTQPYYQYLNEPDDADFYFPTGIVNVSTYLDQTYSGFREEPVYPSDLDVDIKYYLDGVIMDSSAFTLTDASSYMITAEIKDSSLYQDEIQGYLINYTKYKHDVVLTFANSNVNVSSWIDENYTGTIQTVQNPPSYANINYYIDGNLLQGN